MNKLQYEEITKKPDIVSVRIGNTELGQVIQFKYIDRTLTEMQNV